MSKSVYSVVLMDDVVDAVDRLAYEAGTNRSNMINRILAEYVQLATPEQRMQDIFSSIMDAVSGQNALQLMLNASDAMLSMRSAIHYKYNPSMRYGAVPPFHRGAGRGARGPAHTEPFAAAVHRPVL